MLYNLLYTIQHNILLYITYYRIYEINNILYKIRPLHGSLQFTALLQVERGEMSLEPQHMPKEPQVPYYVGFIGF